MLNRTQSSPMFETSQKLTSKPSSKPLPPTNDSSSQAVIVPTLRSLKSSAKTFQSIERIYLTRRCLEEVRIIVPYVPS